MEEQNFSTLIEFINAMEVREDDEDFKNPVDLMFEELKKRKPDHLAVPFLPLWALAVKESERYEPENYEAPWRAGEEQRQNL